MLASPCDRCVFFNKEKTKCAHHQFFISTPKSNFAPGFCRRWRSGKWAENKSSSELIQLSIQESRLTYDLVIIHSNDDNLGALKYSLHCNEHPGICKRVIIADVTRKTDRSQVIDLFKNHKGIKNLDVLMADHEEEKPAQTIKRIFKTIKEKYFVVVPSSKILARWNINDMVDAIDRDTRFIFYPFMSQIAETIIIPSQPVYGLYIANAYETLTRPTEVFKTFFERLKEEELSTGISLSCPLNVIVTNG